MSLHNTKSKLRAEGGFTIVELLIVVVVIAILAAITIVSYNGITSRANDSATKATVGSYQKKAEVYAADGTTGKYPIVSTDLTSDASKTYYISGITTTYVTTDASRTVTSSNGTNTINIRKCAPSAVSQAAITATNITGLQIIYWDYTTNAIVASPTVIGTGACPAAA